MGLFPILMIACGTIASLYLNWIFLSLVSLMVMPLYVGAMVWSGASFLGGVGQAAVGLVALQLSYILSGWILEKVRSRRADLPRIGHPVRAAAENQSRALPEWPLFGGWLPLLAFYEPRCRADGSPWNGIDDPGYRTTVLAVGWFGRAFSLVVGSPKRVKPQGQRNAPSRASVVSELDRRIAAERAKSNRDSGESTDQR
ncbi:hypothetical protein [Methylobacterium sp. WL6]|uniref:hypothetical protein n=1 Tax=Methylobacterium sp. WL6 TaxID=2603901 RepID=UPI0011CBB2C7|nr:hypothetical protein [Methylobacterium sp. WL6]TXN72288.1 hypothetical protein FV230_05520 [Methylobacterium sp. WL6]